MMPTVPRLILFVAYGLVSSQPGTSPQEPGPASNTIFAGGASSTPWIHFEGAAEGHVYVPAKVDGQDVLISLANGIPEAKIDKAFAASIGSKSISGAAKSTAEKITIQFDNLTLRDLAASVLDMSARRANRPFAPIILGDQLFSKVAVDIDFRHHRIAFRDSAKLSPPAQAQEIDLLPGEDGSRTVPIAVEGRAPEQFEVFLGDPAPLTVYQGYYETHGLLKGRPTSIRLGGGLIGQRPEEAVATLNHVRFAGTDFYHVPGVFPSNAVRGSDSDSISGNVGLALLARFRVIIDYPQSRLYTLSYPGAASVPFTKDRLGLYLSEQNDRLVVDFVSPGSPAYAAGFRPHDRIKEIDRRPARSWTPSTLGSVGYRSAGETILFMMEDGSIRRVRAADFS